MGPPLTPKQLLVATWAVGGVCLICTQAVIRLTPMALEPWLDGSLLPWQMVIYVAWLLLNLYLEGYRGFQKAFSPRVVSRAFHIARNPRLVHVLFGPIFAMALFHASRRRLLAAWILLLGIVAIVLVVRQFPQPWRGIVDGGVVIGLLYGTLSILVIFAGALRGRELADPGLPEAPSAQGT